MGLFYQQYLDCGREFSDFYTNTPRVSTVRNNTPQLIYLRWDSSVLDPSQAEVEFFNYDSILPNQTARTFTTRGSFGIYPKTSPDMRVPLSSTVVVPPFAHYFRIRLNHNGLYVTNQVPVNNNNMYDKISEEEDRIGKRMIL